MKSVKQERPKPIYHSWHQDFALDLCIQSFGTCPFGCVKDGAPNCDVNITGAVVPGYAARQCEPGRLTQERAREYVAWLNIQYPQEQPV